MNIKLKNNFKLISVFSFAIAFMIQGLQAVSIDGEEVDFGDNDIIHVSMKVDPQYQHIILDIEDDNITTSIVDNVSVIENSISDYEELNSHRDSFAKTISLQGRVIERAGNADTKGSILHQGSYVYAFDEFIANSNNKITFDSTIAEAGKGIISTAPKFWMENFFVSAPSVSFLTPENVPSWLEGISCNAALPSEDNPYFLHFDGQINFKNPSKKTKDFLIVGADTVFLTLRKM